MHEKKIETECGTGGLQRTESSPEAGLRKEIKAIREGHATGGYCETEKLHEAEKRLYKIISVKLEEKKKEHGYSPDPKFKHQEIRDLELELNGLAWKPKLVVAHDS